MNCGFQIRPGRDFPVTAVTGNPDPQWKIFLSGTKTLVPSQSTYQLPVHKPTNIMAEIIELLTNIHMSDWKSPCHTLSLIIK
jgi:hypothetical protein